MRYRPAGGDLYTSIVEIAGPCVRIIGIALAGLQATLSIANNRDNRQTIVQTLQHIALILLACWYGSWLWRFNRYLTGPVGVEVINAYFAAPALPVDEPLYAAHANQVDTDEEARRKWICPLTLELLKDPVKVSYEESGRRVAFWYEQQRLSEYWRGLGTGAYSAVSGSGFINPASNVALKAVRELRIEHDVDLQKQNRTALQAEQTKVAAGESRRDARVTNRRHRVPHASAGTPSL